VGAGPIAVHLLLLAFPLQVVQAVANPDLAIELPLTAENVEMVLGEVRHILWQMEEMLHCIRLMGIS